MEGVELVTLLPPLIALAIAGYWAVLLRRYPNQWPRNFEMLPFRRERRTGRTWRIVAVLGIVAGLATAAFTLLLALQTA
jgi:hypothetical protein